MMVVGFHINVGFHIKSFKASASLAGKDGEGD